MSNSAFMSKMDLHELVPPAHPFFNNNPPHPFFNNKPPSPA